MESNSRSRPRLSNQRRHLLGGFILGCFLALSLLGNPHRADAGVEDVTNCVGPLECLYFATGYSDQPTPNLPDDITWDLEPVTTEPSDTDGAPWQGTFRIIQHKTKGMDDRQCMEAATFGTSISYTSSARLRDCSNSVNQRWYFEPAASTVVTDLNAPDAWDPWWRESAPSWSSAEKLDSKLYLRSAGDRGGNGTVRFTDRCYASTSSGLVTDTQGSNVRLSICGDSGSGPARDFHFNFYNFEGPHTGGGTPSRVTKTASQRRELTRVVLSSILQHAMAECERDIDDCRTKLKSSETGSDLSDWARMNQVVIDRQPNPVVEPIGCAGSNGQGGSAQTIYNAGSADMNTTIEASGTSSFSEFLNNGISVMVGTEIGSDGFFKAKMEVTTTVEWGKTWSKSQTLAQSVSWTIPPQRYATAVMAASAVRTSALWEFGKKDFNQWGTNDAVSISVPYSKSPNAVSPDTVLAVYNSYAPKNCDASSPSVLDPDRSVAVHNQTQPGSAPVPGDVLEAEADPSWWQVPLNDPTPANLRYQWYRQRGNEPVVLIQGARQPTYKVTNDDLTDPELIPRLGRYRIFVGVTEVAGPDRFDSLQSTSVSTPSVVAERSEAATNLTLSVVNPEADTSTDVIADIRAHAPLSDTSPQGEVEISSGDQVISTVTLGAGGQARARFRLPRGVHHLEATYDGIGTFHGAMSNVVPVNVAGTSSNITLKLSSNDLTVGDTSTAQVQVSGGQGHQPSGEVQFLIDGDPTGLPVLLNDREAELELPTAVDIGRRVITARYAGDQNLNASTSSPTIQNIVAKPLALVSTRAQVMLERAVTHRRGGAKVRAKLETRDGQPLRGSVQFRLDGRLIGPELKLDPSGEAALQVGAVLARGERKFSAEFSHPDGYAPPPSKEAKLEVRRFGVKLGTNPDRRVVRKGQVLTLKGRIKPTKRKLSIGRPKLTLQLGDRRLAVKKVRADGRYRFRIKPRSLAKGRNTLTISYSGSSLRSIAPGDSRVTVIRR